MGRSQIYSDLPSRYKNSQCNSPEGETIYEHKKGQCAMGEEGPWGMRLDKQAKTRLSMYFWIIINC